MAKKLETLKQDIFNDFFLYDNLTPFISTEFSIKYLLIIE